MKILIVVNEDVFFLSHRREIALHAQAAGHDVTIVTKDTGRLHEIQALGLRTIPLEIHPTGMNPREELRTLRFLHRLYHEEQPDVVHHVGLKVMLWGGLAAKWAKVPGVLNAVSGLGTLFDTTRKNNLMRKVMLRLLRYGHKRHRTKSGDVCRVFDLFQNREDEAIFLQNHVTRPENARFIKGSGVNLALFKPEPEPEGKVRVLFSGRMVKEKGVGVLVEAANLLRPQYADKAEFVLCGGLHANPHAYTEADIRAMCDGSYITWLGLCKDMHQQLRRCHIFAFPSAYREGVPKSLIEACACGRPIVTTDNTGCRDVVEDGINGYRVPVYDAPALADRLKTLIDSPTLRRQFGQAARQQAEREFSVEEVARKHLAIYEELTNTR